MLMDILTALLDGPKLPTRLAQTCNLNYDNLVRLVAMLESSRMVEKKVESGHELYSISPDGFKVQEQFKDVLLKLGADFGSKSETNQ